MPRAGIQHQVARKVHGSTMPLLLGTHLPNPSSWNLRSWRQSLEMIFSRYQAMTLTVYTTTLHWLVLRHPKEHDLTSAKLFHRYDQTPLRHSVKIIMHACNLNFLITCRTRQVPSFTVKMKSLEGHKRMIV